MTSNTWLSVDEAASYLGVKRDTVYAWITKRCLPAYKVGRLWKLRQPDIDRWLARDERRAAAAAERGDVNAPAHAQVVDHLREGFQIIGRDYRYVYLNHAAIAHARKPKDELLGRTMMAAYPGIERTSMFDALRHCMEARVPAQMENEFTFPDGTTGWFDLRMTPVPAGVVVLSFDISQRKQLELDLRQSNEQLEEFADTAAHDLKAPLRKLVAFSDALTRDLDGVALPPRAAEDLDAIVSSATHLQSLIQDQLDLARLRQHPLEPQRVDVGACIDQAVSDLGTVIEEAAPVFSRDELPSVDTDRHLLLGVYQNLIANAVKYRMAGRQLSIRFTAEPCDNTWVLGVRDNGIGIAAEHLEFIFRRGKRLHSQRQYEGTGIGLALCRRAMQRLGGRIWAESEGPGHGSHFKFQLPPRPGGDQP